MAPTPTFFAHLAGSIMRRSERVGVVHDRRIRAHFGVTTHTLTIASKLVKSQLNISLQPEHLLWACMFLKLYSTEHVHAGMAGVDEKTFRKHVWTSVKALAQLKVVSSYCFFSQYIFDSNNLD